MRRIVAIAVLCVTLGASALASPVRVVILAGQSNAVG